MTHKYWCYFEDKGCYLKNSILVTIYRLGM
jgi:hypothetical protein